MTVNLKALIRKEKMDARRALHADDWQYFSLRIVERLQTCIKESSQPVAIYYPVRGEVDVLPLMQHMDICLPVTQADSKELLFRVCAPGQHLEKNRHGVMQPADSAELCEPDILIVPLVAFDREGFRIGYGGGYYDITLAMLHKKRKITAIGAAFSFQETVKVPREVFDTRLDIIITEKEMLTFA